MARNGSLKARAKTQWLSHFFGLKNLLALKKREGTPRSFLFMQVIANWYFPYIEMKTIRCFIALCIYSLKNCFNFWFLKSS